MASQTASPGTLATEAFGITDWSNPGNAASSNNSYATCVMVDGGEGSGSSYLLKATNFGFGVPGGATIDGILVEVEASENAGVLFASMQLIVGGTSTGDDYGTGVLNQSGDAYYPFGGSTDKWGLTPSVADVNGSDFGVGVAFNTGTPPQTVSVDHIRITVYYTEAGGGGMSTARVGGDIMALALAAWDGLV